MKKWLFLTLRILFAAAGLTYILLSLSFTDQVVVPAGTRIDDGRILTAPTALSVVAGDLSAAEGQIVVMVGQANGRSVTHTFAAEQLGLGENNYQPQPSIVTMLQRANLKLVLLGLLAVVPIYPIGAFRWWLLMRCRGLDVTLWRSFRLSMVGNFFNFCMPVGTTGGDLVRAYYAAKRSDRRAESLTSIVVDRVVGLAGLFVLAALAGLFMWREPMVRRVTTTIALAIGLMLLGAVVYLTPQCRRAVGFDWILARLPARRWIASFDRAAVAYRHHKRILLWAVFLSVLVHGGLATGTALAAGALGMKTPFTVLLNVVPVLFLAAAIPLTYQGLGIMEGLAIGLILDPPGTAANHILGMLLLVRLYQVFVCMFGSLFLLQGNIHMDRLR